MGRIRKEEIDRTEELLNQRWSIAENMKLEQSNIIANKAYYEGMLKAVEFLGYSWQRDRTGNHKLFKD